MRIPGCVGNNPILVKLFWTAWSFITLKSYKTPKQGIAIIKPTAHKSICSSHSHFLCKMLFKPPEIPQLDKTGKLDKELHKLGFIRIEFQLIC